VNILHIVGTIIMIAGVGVVCLIGLCAIAAAFLGGMKECQGLEDEEDRHGSED
jgi:hypothetical protein